MKTHVTLFMLCALWLNVLAQAPQKMSYQAVVRNASGELVTNHAVGMRISILQGSESGSVVYSEICAPLPQTNTNGLVTIEIGSGTPLTGTFSGINWAAGPYYLKTETDPSGGTSYTISGTSPLLSVPYALYARDVQNGDKWGSQTVVHDYTLSGTGTVATPLGVADNGISSAKIADNSVQTADLVDNSVTSAKIATGAVTGTKIAQAGATDKQVLKWNGSTWAPADDVTGGSGFSLPYSDSGSSINPVFQVTNSGTGDGIKGIATSAAKTGLVGEAPNQGISGVSTAISGAAYGVQGTSASSTGSGVTGFGSSTTGKNFGVRGITASGSGTAIYGVATATSGTTYGVWGESNAAAGWGIYGKGPSGGVYGISPDYSGYGVFGESTADAGWGVYGKGKIALYGNSIYVDGRGVVGSATGSGVTYGVYGSSTSSEGIGLYGSNTSSTGTTKGVYGRSGSSSGYGVYGEGKTALYGTTSSSSGYAVHAECTSTTGYTRGVSSTVYSSDGFSGYFAGGKFVVTSSRVGLGTVLPAYQLDVAGTANLIDGISGVALRCNGDEAIWYNGIYYSWGYGGTYNFFGDKVFIGAVATDPGTHHLVVNGTAAKPGGGSWATWSDERLKTIHGNYSKGLDEIARLQPVIYSYKTGNRIGLPDGINYIGLVAQEVQKVFPEAITTGSDGYLTYDSTPVNIALINAIKELKSENNILKAQNDYLKADMNQMKTIYETRLSKLESLLEVTSDK